MNDQHEVNLEFRQLIELFLDEQLSEQQRDRFRQLMTDNLGFREVYRQQVLTHAALMWRGGWPASGDFRVLCPLSLQRLSQDIEEILHEQHVADEPVVDRHRVPLLSNNDYYTPTQNHEYRSSSQRSAARAFRTASKLGLATLALLAFVIFASRSSHGPHEASSGKADSNEQQVASAAVDSSATSNESHPPVAPPAVLVGSTCAVWESPGLLTSVNTPVPARPVCLKQGVVEVLFSDGAAVVFEAPASFEVVSASRFKLNYGKAVGRVPPEAIGFTVHTPGVEVVDLGTEFAILAEESGEAEVHVLNGAVQAKATRSPKDVADNRVILRAGKAINVHQDGSFQKTKASPDRFYRRIPSLVAVETSLEATRNLRLIDSNNDNLGNEAEVVFDASRSDQASKHTCTSVGESWLDADSKERRFVVEFDLRCEAFRGLPDADLVDNATFSVALVAMEGVDLLRADLHGLSSELGAEPLHQSFEANSKLLSPAMAHASSRKNRSLITNVTKFVKAALQRGDSTVAFRLQAAGGDLPNGDGKFNGFQFYTSGNEKKAWRPKLVIRGKTYSALAE